MIKSFGIRLAEDLYFDRQSRATRAFQQGLRRAARRKLLYLNDAAVLKDLRVPPGNRLEALKGDLQGKHSVHINEQWRLVFRWQDGNAYEVEISDYH